MRRLSLERLRIRAFRNLTHVDLEGTRRINVIAGNNGHGKTSVLEAIYFAATSRSFRTHRAADLVQHGNRVASVAARFSEGSSDMDALSREQTAAVEQGRSVVRVDGNRPSSLAEYATRSPVVAFHPDELALSSGPASGRRLLLDRLALFMDPRSADHRARYARALKARHELLRKGQGEPIAAEVEVFEELCATHGAALTRARAEAAEALERELLVAFGRIAAPDLVLTATYAPGGSASVEEARAELAEQRRRDAHRATAGFGPHRDDLALCFSGRPVRVVASQGQHRALTLALKAAETAAIAGARGIEPILLLDDVSSELDADRTAALFEFLSFTRGQIFLTTTRPELIVTPEVPPEARCVFRVEGGALQAAS